MNTRRIGFYAAILCGFLASIAILASAALAHCDGMDGPVVKAAQKALAANDVDLVLVWVQPADEQEIRTAFARTLTVRKLGREAQELADTYFFETLVRVHRAGEGAPYTGLVPAGRDLGPAIPLADEALATGKIEPLVELLTHEARAGLVERFEHARAAKAAVKDVASGRESVHAYVEFIHYAERVHTAATQTVSGHGGDAEGDTDAHEH